jgi:hypothetical protein
VKLTLNIGKDGDGELWLCLADADTTAVYAVAKFVNEDHCDLFQAYMGTQGYAAVKLLTDQDINNLLDDIGTTES